MASSDRIHSLRTSAIVALVVGCGLSSCQADVQVGAQHRAVAGDERLVPPETPDAVADGSGAPEQCEPAPCGPRTYACGDCRDNDDDGLVDSDDPDCVGPCHNAEDTFYGSIPGQNEMHCEQDCYFDANSGIGDDRCSWTHACDPLAVAPDYPPGGSSCAYDPNTLVAVIGLPRGCGEIASEQGPECLNACLPLVPNGCDCFGCCEIPGAPFGTVWLGSNDGTNGTCDRGSLADVSRCRPCTQVPSCLNPCERCELCVGKTVLPADCPGIADSPECPVPSCREDQQPCGSACLPRCPAGQSCITGCCVQPPR